MKKFQHLEQMAKNMLSTQGGLIEGVDWKWIKKNLQEVDQNGFVLRHFIIASLKNIVYFDERSCCDDTDWDEGQQSSYQTS